MSFKDKEVDKLLAQCHRRCCVCHKFAGFKMELHHIKEKSKGGSDDIENGIPLCFECHAEVALYNPEHPKGKKYSDNELLEHKKQWLYICKSKPEVLVSLPTNSDIGPLEGMVLELEFNIAVAKLAEGAYPQDRIGCSLRLAQYERAIFEGAILLLSDEVKEKLTQAYLVIGRSNNFITTLVNTRPEGNALSTAQDNVFKTLRDGITIIEEAYADLKNFLLITKKII